MAEIGPISGQYRLAIWVVSALCASGREEHYVSKIVPRTGCDYIFRVVKNVPIDVSAHAQ